MPKIPDYINTYPAELPYYLRMYVTDYIACGVSPEDMEGKNALTVRGNPHQVKIEAASKAAQKMQQLPGEIGVLVKEMEKIREWIANAYRYVHGVQIDGMEMRWEQQLLRDTQKFSADSLKSRTTTMDVNHIYHPYLDWHDLILVKEEVFEAKSPRKPINDETMLDLFKRLAELLDLDGEIRIGKSLLFSYLQTDEASSIAVTDRFSRQLLRVIEQLKAEIPGIEIYLVLFGLPKKDETSKHGSKLIIQRQQKEPPKFDIQGDHYGALIVKVKGSVQTNWKKGEIYEVEKADQIDPN
jgi:hypothetical protein